MIPFSVWSHFVMRMSGHVTLSAVLSSDVCVSSLCYRRSTVQSAAALTAGLRRVKTACVESNSNSNVDSVPSENNKKIIPYVVQKLLDPNLLWTTAPKVNQNVLKK